MWISGVLNFRFVGVFLGSGCRTRFASSSLALSIKILFLSPQFLQVKLYIPFLICLLGLKGAATTKIQLNVKCEKAPSLFTFKPPVMAG